jgi:acetylornithine/succinyldiaminopimelate/putrescine aminotransferase
MPVVLVRGEGPRVWDTEGKSYSTRAGFAVKVMGHGHPSSGQFPAGARPHPRQQLYTPFPSWSCRAVIEESCLDKIFYANCWRRGERRRDQIGAHLRPHAARHGAYEVITATIRSTDHPGERGGHGGRRSSEASCHAAGFKNRQVQRHRGPEKSTTPETAAVMLECVEGESERAPGTIEYL